jgi:WD40 repeat protein
MRLLILVLACHAPSRPTLAPKPAEPPSLRVTVTLTPGRDGEAVLQQQASDIPFHLVRARWSPGDEAIALVDPHGVQLRDAKDGALRASLVERRIIQQSAFSPDGARFAYGTDDGALHLWQLSDGAVMHLSRQELLRAFVQEDYATPRIVWSPDGKRLVSAVDEGFALWEPPRLVASFAGQSAAWSPDGKQLAMVRGEGEVALLDRDGKLVRVLARDRYGALAAVAWSRDGRLAVGGERGIAFVLDGAQAPPRKFAIAQLAWSPDGKRLAIGLGNQSLDENPMYDHGVTLWSSEREVDLPDAFPGVNRLAWSGDGERVELDGPDNVVRIADAASGRILSTESGYQQIPAHDLRRMLLLREQSWRLVDGDEKWRVEQGEDPSRISLQLAGRRALWQRGSGWYVVDLENGTLVRSFEREVALSGARIALAAPKALTLIDGVAQRSIPLDGSLGHLSFSPRGSFVMGKLGNQCALFSTAIGAKRLVPLPDLAECGLSPDEKLLLVVAFRGALTAADASTGAARWSLPAGDYNQLPEWSPDGKRFFWPSSDGARIVGADGTVERTLVGGVLSGWSPDGRFLVSDEYRRGPCVVEVASGACVAMLPASQVRESSGVASRLEFSPDGAYLLRQSGNDDELRILDAHTGALTRAVPNPGHGHAIWVGPQTVMAAGHELTLTNVKSGATLWLAGTSSLVALTPEGEYDGEAGLVKLRARGDLRTAPLGAATSPHAGLYRQFLSR